MNARIIPGLLLVGLLMAAADRPDDEMERLRREYRWFSALPPERQEDLRTLDRKFSEADEKRQAQWKHVLERYQIWLAKLPEADRKAIRSASSSKERLRLIEDLREKEWLETLPEAYRKQYAATTKPLDRTRLLEKWREEERERREEWAFTGRMWIELQKTPIPPIFQHGAMVQEIETYATHLDSQLSPNDRARLRAVREGEDRDLYRYARTIVELSDRYVLKPGPLTGPKSLEEMPAKLREAVHKHLRKKPLGKDVKEIKELQPLVGRWPDYAIAFQKYAASINIIHGETFGPTRKMEMPKETWPAIDELEKSPETQTLLAAVEGKWPEYPQTVMELCRDHKIAVRGWTLPGDPAMWTRYRPVNRKP